MYIATRRSCVQIPDPFNCNQLSAADDSDTITDALDLVEFV